MIPERSRRPLPGGGREKLAVAVLRRLDRQLFPRVPIGPTVSELAVELGVAPQAVRDAVEGVDSHVVEGRVPQWSVEGVCDLLRVAA